MNNKGGVINIVVVLLITVFVLIILMQPVILLNNNAEEQLAINAGITKTGTNSDGDIVDVGPASSLGDITLVLLLGIGFFFLIAIAKYIISFGKDPPSILRRDF